MEKSKLISESNKIIEDFEETHSSEIKKMITDSITEANFISVIKKEDLRGSIGFYMIFCDAKPSLSICTCQIKISGKDYYCVYRGGATTVKERVISHLYFDLKSEYPNCMKILLGDNRYNINLDSKTLFKDREAVSEVPFPDWKWGVIRIPLDGSKQALRDMFERGFDALYGMPSFSDK